MGLLLGILAALFGAGAVTLVGTRQGSPKWLRAEGPGLSVLTGMLLAVGVTMLTGQAVNLVSILALIVAVVALLTAALTAAGLHLVWRLTVQGSGFVIAMWVLYWRGDLYAVPAAVAALFGVLAVNVVGFAVGAAERSQARLVSPVTFLAGAGYLLWVGWRLPNPGLVMFVAFAAATMVPLFDRASRSGGSGLLLGPTLGALVWAGGFYAWLGNASLPMVLAPVLIVGVDVLFALVRRLTTANGRATLAPAGSWWHRLDALAQPGDDLVAQRLVGAFGASKATGYVAGATLLAAAVGILGWYLGLGTALASAPLVLLAAAWVAVPMVLTRLQRA
ncbi:MAG: hypothetical protein Q3997_00590 [Propionibacteriaceae bacterium]|nr:hypothetical protein [Propionibacteriaceae bacterium]